MISSSEDASVIVPRAVTYVPRALVIADLVNQASLPPACPAPPAPRAALLEALRPCASATSVATSSAMPRRSPSPSPSAPPPASPAAPGLLRAALLVCLAVLVQSFMLLQVGYFYLRMRWRHHQPAAAADELADEARDGALSRAPTISCVVMARNEEAAIRATVRTLATRAKTRTLIEVVVVDSGCTDGTMDAARDEAAAASPAIATTLVTAPGPGRGAALDAGCSAATGEIIFVCHADCIVPQDWDEMIRQGLAEPGVLATAFKFQLNREELPPAEGGLPGGGVMEFTVNLRATWLQLPFGDQGLALPAKRLAR